MSEISLPDLAAELGILCVDLAGHVDTLIDQHGETAVIAGTQRAYVGRTRMMDHVTVLTDWAAAQLRATLGGARDSGRVAHLRRYNPATSTFDTFTTRTLLPRTAAHEVTVYGPNYGLAAGASVQVEVFQDGQAVDWAWARVIGRQVSDEAAADIEQDARHERAADAAAA